MNLWKKKTTRIPTDLEILDAIYERYKDAYVGGVEGKDRPVNYVSVDIPMIAEALGAEPNGIFGRLYYHLQPKYGYQKMVDDRMVSVHFFDIEIGGKRHCIHFPLMMSVLAGLRKEHSFSQTAMWISIIALGVSILSFLWGLAGD